MSGLLIVMGCFAIIAFPVTGWFRFEHALFFGVLGSVLIIVGLLMAILGLLI